MLLAIDVGNTQTAIGVFKGKDLICHWRISTHSEKTGDEWAATITSLLSLQGVQSKDIKAAIVSSVVPAATHALEEMISSALAVKPIFVIPEVKMDITLLYDNPREIGADRIVNAVAAYNLYGGPAIVVDFGTATTFDVISEKGEYLGGAIAPGIEISTDALFEKAAKLSKVEFRKPARAVGKNTVESLQSGIIYGFAGQVDSMVERIIGELRVGERDRVKVIATGGLAEVLVPICKTITQHDPLLTLEGLKILYDLNT
jgi:type III pantothenate kinase